MEGMKEPKEGVDFKWVVNPGTNVKTRKFFNRGEKAEMAKKSTSSTPSSTTAKKAPQTSAPKTSVRPKLRQKVSNYKDDQKASRTKGVAKPNLRDDQKSSRTNVRKAPSVQSKAPAAPKAPSAPKKSGVSIGEGSSNRLGDRTLRANRRAAQSKATRGNKPPKKTDMQPMGKKPKLKDIMKGFPNRPKYY